MYHLNTKVVKRFRSSAAAVVAYRVGFKLCDPYDRRMRYPHRNPEEIQSQFVFNWDQKGKSAGDALVYQAIIDEIGRTERRCNSRLFKEFVFALPKEGTDEERAILAEEFAANLAKKYGVSLILGIHEPPNLETGNWHAHALATTRIVLRDATGKPRLGKKNRRLDGVDMVPLIRKDWEILLNSFYAKKNLSKRVSCESNETLGIPKIPTIHEGPKGKKGDRALMNRAISHYNSQAPKDAVFPADIFATIPDQLDELKSQKVENNSRIEALKTELEERLPTVLLDVRQTKQAKALHSEVTRVVTEFDSPAEVVIALQKSILRGGKLGGPYNRLRRSLPPSGGSIRLGWVRDGLDLIALLFQKPDQAALEKLEKWKEGPVSTVAPKPDLDGDLMLRKMLEWLEYEEPIGDQDRKPPSR